MHDPVQDGVGVRPAAEPLVPFRHGILGAPYRRGRIAAPVDQLKHEAHLVGVQRVDEPFVHDQDVVARIFPQELLLRGACREPLLPVHEEVRHPHIERPEAPLAGLLGKGACEVCLPRPGVSHDHDVAVRLRELAGPQVRDQLARERAAVVNHAGYVCRAYPEVRPLQEPLDADVLLLLEHVVGHDAHPVIEWEVLVAPVVSGKLV